MNNKKLTRKIQIGMNEEKPTKRAKRELYRGKKTENNIYEIYERAIITSKNGWKRKINK